MDVRNTYFLELLKAALEGRQTPPERALTAEDWQALVAQAQRHKVLPLICQTAQASAVPEVKAEVRRQVAGQMLKTGQFLALNRHLRQAGLTPLVVKGIVCRELYPEPDLRLSADEDLLLPEDQFAAGCAALEQFGMFTTEKDPDAYERPYRMEGGPLYIELHRSMFPPESDAYGHWNRFFVGAFRRAVEMEVGGEKVLTLCHTDHLLYLILHAFKHFLHSGFGIRQVCDMVMYANAFGSGIDWEQLLEHCRQVRAERFTAAVFRIGQKHLGFDPEKAGYPASWQALQGDEKPLLEDLLSAGVYGGATESRKHSSNVTLEAVAGSKRGKRGSSALRSALFPPLKTLRGRYPYLKKYPWLLPVAWADRALRYGTRKDKGGDNSAAEAIRIGNQRLELLRHYGVID